MEKDLTFYLYRTDFAEKPPRYWFTMNNVSEEEQTELKLDFVRKYRNVTTEMTEQMLKIVDANQGKPQKDLVEKLDAVMRGKV